jgi:hypothetical protein
MKEGGWISMRATYRLRLSYRCFKIIGNHLEVAGSRLDHGSKRAVSACPTAKLLNVDVRMQEFIGSKSQEEM